MSLDWNDLDGVLSFPEGSEVVYAKGVQHRELGDAVAFGEALIVLPDGQAQHVKVRVETFPSAAAAPPTGRGHR